MDEKQQTKARYERHQAAIQTALSEGVHASRAHAAGSRSRAKYQTEGEAVLYADKLYTENLDRVRSELGTARDEIALLDKALSDEKSAGDKANEKTVAKLEKSREKLQRFVSMGSERAAHERTVAQLEGRTAEKAS